MSELRRNFQSIETSRKYIKIVFVPLPCRTVRIKNNEFDLQGSPVCSPNSDVSFIFVYNIAFARD